VLDSAVAAVAVADVAAGEAAGVAVVVAVAEDKPLCLSPQQQ